MKLREELDLAVRAAREAGALLRDAFHRDKAVLSQKGRDIKLQADRDAEAAILKILGSSAHGVLAEESGEHGELDTDLPVWIVDPLDGTMNFSRGIPLCCVSIALSQRDNPLLGVVYDFSADDLFTGIVGEGAWHNGEAMSVSGITESPKAILSTGFPVNFAPDDAGMLAFAERIRRFKKVRMFGTAALSLAYVACGRVDAYSEEDIMFWDIAAGLALVLAAGGHVQMENAKLKWSRRVHCAANEGIWTS